MSPYCAMASRAARSTDSPFMLLLGLIGAFFGGGVGVLIAIADAGSEALVANDQPITEGRIRDKLQSDGWVNVNVKNEGRYFEASGFKGGRWTTIAVDAVSGHLMDSDED